MDSYSPEKQVIVVGYPRSGNTWLARLLGDALNSPVTGWKDAKPLAEEGQKRNGAYTVRQLHLQPTYQDGTTEFMPTAYLANIPMWNGENVIHIFRDPRDVAVSVMHYWNISDIDEAVRKMISGDSPVKTHGPWMQFVNKWMAVEDIRIFHTTYETISNLTHSTLKLILNDFMRLNVSPETIDQAIYRQDFNNKKQHIKDHGGLYNYGRTIQLKAMRKGIIHDWFNHFTPSAKQMAEEAWGEFMRDYAYEFDPNWWVS